MKSEIPYRVSVSFPGELDYIPLVRQLVSDALQVLKFSPKFSFRSEFLVDELCNNAVIHGSPSDRQPVEVLCDAYADRVEIFVKGAGGYHENIQRFREAIAEASREKGHDIELIRLLSDTVTCTIDDNNVSHIHVVRMREC
jgi:anti-sigma regulatory factor (Ser/Thr protein kinase)